jgi:forkhead box protein K
MVRSWDTSFPRRKVNEFLTPEYGSALMQTSSCRSQIQIASRTFHFVLPPPPPPEDTPSPSSQSSINLPRSPSLDITSISPPSSQPSHTPPPTEDKVVAPPPEPQIIDPPPKLSPVITTQPQLPNSNSIGKSIKTANSKKRKKGDDDTVHPRPKPEDMPPKPPFTYAQLIYRAIKAIGDKATLQEICSWIMNTYEYYRYAEAGWTVTLGYFPP